MMQCGKLFLDLIRSLFEGVRIPDIGGKKGLLVPVCGRNIPENKAANDPFRHNTG